jgi:hypothetical protein
VTLARAAQPTPLVLLALLALLALLTLSACQRTLDVASIQDPSWVATTISYTGVREVNRQFPDYNIIDASILKTPAGGAKSPPTGKQGPPR